MSQNVYLYKNYCNVWPSVNSCFERIEGILDTFFKIGMLLKVFIYYQILYVFVWKIV